MSTFYLKNETGAAVIIEDLGINLPDDTSLIIDSNEIPGYLSADLIASLTTPELVLSTTDVGNSGGDLSVADAQAALNITSRYDRDNPHSVTVTQAITEDSNTDITTIELEELSDGSETALHIHDDRYYTEIELSTSNTGTVEVHWDNITSAPTFGALHWRAPVICNIIEKGTAVEMAAFSAIEGHFWWNSDDDHLYRYTTGSWVDQGAPVDGDRMIYRDGVANNDYIYQHDGSTWGAGVMPEDNWAVMVNDDYGGPGQFVYDSDTTLPPNWIKIADVDWGDHNSIGGRDAASAHPATSISYINTTSGLTAIEVQAAIDEIDSNVDTIITNLSNHEGDTTNPHSVTFTQAVAADAGTDITVIEAENLTDGSNADLLHIHDAESITFTSNSGLTSINVEDALDELHVDILDFKMPKGTVFPLTPDEADLFYRTDLNMAFQYDASRSMWISMTQMFLDWGANVADGKYLKIHGAAATQTGYLMPHNGVILNVTAKCASGNQSKGFAIRRNNDSGSQLYTFALSGGEFTSSTTITFDYGDYLQAYATSIGVPSRDVVVMATIAYIG